VQRTALELARRFVGLREIPGAGSNPFVSGLLGLVLAEMAGQGIGSLPASPPDDETPWCSAAAFFPAFILNLPRPSKHSDPAIVRLALRARAWLTIGTDIGLESALPGWDCVILNRAGGLTDPTIINAPGHVGLYVAHDAERVCLCGGNQGNQWSESWYAKDQILGVRRWWTGP
jgi:hypothetical protein